jgi:hypothetical protein
MSKEAINIFPTYHGHPDENLNEWIGRMELAFKFHGTTSTKKPIIAAICLKDKAYSWYNNHQTEAQRQAKASGTTETENPNEAEITTWEQLKTCLQQRFAIHQNGSHTLQRLRELVWKPESERLEEYVNVFYMLTGRLTNMPDYWLKDEFMKGLPPSYRSDLISHPPATLSAAVQRAYQMEASNHLTVRQSTSTKKSSRMYVDDPMDVDVNRLENQQPPRRREIRCFECDGIGHMRYECPRLRRRKNRRSPQHNQLQADSVQEQLLVAVNALTALLSKSNEEQGNSSRQ